MRFGKNEPTQFESPALNSILRGFNDQNPAVLEFPFGEQCGGYDGYDGCDGYDPMDDPMDTDILPSIEDFDLTGLLDETPQTYDFGMGGSQPQVHPPHPPHPQAAASAGATRKPRRQKQAKVQPSTLTRTTGRASRLEEVFTKEILRSEPTAFSAFRDQHASNFTEAELEELNKLRKKERACVHAAKSRIKRITAKTECESENVKLHSEIEHLRAENLQLRQQLEYCRAMMQGSGEG